MPVYRLLRLQYSLTHEAISCPLWNEVASTELSKRKPSNMMCTGGLYATPHEPEPTCGRAGATPKRPGALNRAMIVESARDRCLARYRLSTAVSWMKITTGRLMCYNVLAAIEGTTYCCCCVPSSPCPLTSWVLRGSNHVYLLPDCVPVVSTVVCAQLEPP